MSLSARQIVSLLHFSYAALARTSLPSPVAANRSTDIKIKSAQPPRRLISTNAYSVLSTNYSTLFISSRFIFAIDCLNLLASVSCRSRNYFQTH